MTETAINAQPVVVPEGANTIVAHVSGHTFVALLLGGEERVVDRSGGAVSSFAVDPGAYELATDGHLGDIATESVERLDPAMGAMPGASAAALRLTIDAPDTHVADGVGELPADGSAPGTVTVEKLDGAGQPLTGPQDTDEVFLRTTGGVLQSAAGKDTTRSVVLKRGRATFRVVGDAPPRLVTVTAFSVGTAQADLPIEFV